MYHCAREEAGAASHPEGRWIKGRNGKGWLRQAARKASPRTIANLIKHLIRRIPVPHAWLTNDTRV